jgi:hypothetical protein
VAVVSNKHCEIQSDRDNTRNYNTKSAYTRISTRNTKMNKSKSKQNKTKQHKTPKQKIKMVVKEVVKNKIKKHLPDVGSIGQKMGSKLGKWVGGGVQSLLGKITGLGDYTLSGARQVGLDGGPPQFASGRTVRVAHREYLGDISSSIAFASNTYEINPGDAETFPWLSKIAVNFEEYKFHGLVFEFKSTSATALNSTNTALGTVVMATQYDSVEPTFSNKREMENHEFATSTMPYQSVLHGVETKPKLTSISTNLYVLVGPQPADTDIRLYNLGKFTLATVGMQAVSTIGELWVSYDVEFFKPQLLPAGAANAYAHYSLIEGGDVTMYSPFGAISTSSTAPTEFAIIEGSTLDYIYFPRTPASVIGKSVMNTIQFDQIGTFMVLFTGYTNSEVLPALTTSVWDPYDGCALTGTQFEFNAPEPYNGWARTEASGFIYCQAYAAVNVTTAGGKLGLLFTTNESESPASNPSFTTSDLVIIPIPSYFQLPKSKMELLKISIENDLKKKFGLETIHEQKEWETPLTGIPTPVRNTNLTDSTVLARAISKLMN